MVRGYVSFMEFTVDLKRARKVRFIQRNMFILARQITY